MLLLLEIFLLFPYVKKSTQTQKNTEQKKKLLLEKVKIADTHP